ncbi:unnamed protein product [Agarophyton chilense]|eukprot:gb/GEZJ01000931.1/.p1 GENE.gb/GEZJ01000931.1/~~gb/GEZJ01000931.1/.p1  ORF type:complete len:700 (-),score=118.00 gb/GEZJ01000931.1/:4995-7094(-)
MTASELQNGAVDELRQLFDKGQYEAVLTRVHQFRKRNRKRSPSISHILDTAHAFSLIHLGRSDEAIPSIEAILQSNFPPFKQQLLYAKAYAAWATNERLGEAIELADPMQGEHFQNLKAQLLYRAGRYDEAVALYEQLLTKARSILKEKKQPAATSRWRLPGITSRTAQVASPVTAAELEQLTSAVNELTTNAMASMILARSHDKLPSVQEGLRPSYEIEYNAACSHIALADFGQAETCLEKAEALINSELDEEDDDIEEATAPLFVQQAYLKHMAGNIEAAKQSYYEVVNGRRCDAASLAVAANNLTVAIGQLALGKSTLSMRQDGTRALSKQQHEALVEGLKKMKTTASKNVVRKLTSHQREAMGRNRAVLFVQMGRLDACRAEIEMLKVHHSDDSLVCLLEASLLAKNGELESADKMLSEATDTPIIRAARVQLAASLGEKYKAAELLQQLFPECPAAVLTAASLLEQCDRVQSGISFLQAFVSKASGELKTKASRDLAAMLLRNGLYRESAEILRDYSRSSSSDAFNTAQLVVATSHFDPVEADRLASKLPGTSLNVTKEDAERLEQLPPPKRKHLSNRPASASTDVPEKLPTITSRREKKKPKKKRLPKNYDPNGPPPDPERWIPKTLRSGYRKKKAKRDPASFRGSQGADAASAEAAAQSLAEKAHSKASSAQANALPPRSRARLQRRKKGRK